MHGGDVWREGAPGDWLDFSANIRPGGPPAWVKDALLAGISDVSYYPDLRMERARAALGAYLNLGPDWVLPTAGGISAIALAMRLDAPGAIAFGPCFSEYAEIAADSGMKMRELSLLSGRESAPEAPRCAAPCNCREPDKLTATPLRSTSSAAQSSVPLDDCAPGRQTAIPCGSKSSDSSRAHRKPNERSSALKGKPGDDCKTDERSAALKGASGDGLKPDECSSALKSTSGDDCKLDVRSAKLEIRSSALESVPGDDRKSGEPFTVSSRTGPFSVVSSIHHDCCAADVSLPARRGKQDERFATLESASGDDRKPDEPFTASGETAPFSVVSPVHHDCCAADVSSPARRGKQDERFATLESASGDDRKPDEPFTASGGTASFSVVSPVHHDCCAADAPSPVRRDRHALAAPSEVLRGNMSPGAAVWLCNPLNPMGAAFPRAEIEALLRRVEAAGGWLVLDEAFVHCCPERTSVDLLAMHPRLVIVGSLTKSLGIPGARAGYICANPELLRKLARRQCSWELNCFAESAIRALPDHAAELRAEAALNAARREVLRRDLEALGAYVYPSEACFLLADFGRDVSPIVNRLREKGILIRQCADFHGIDDGHHLRLAVKDEAANARLIDALREALHWG